MDTLQQPVKWSRWVLTGVGSVVILLALASYLTNKALPDLLVWAQQVFGWGFAGLYSLLLIAGVYACQSMKSDSKAAYFWEMAQQAGNGIATLALTFTLLGISLGIGSLSEQPLTPDTIQNIIGELTAQFSTAFMTTVVGLPTATLLRAWSSIRLHALTVNKGETL